MASGFGWGGGRSRCFTYWQEFQRCYVQLDQHPSECRPQINDYLECLHHPKEIERARAIQDEYIRKAAEAGRKATEAGHKAARVNSEGTSAAVELRQKEDEPVVDKK